MQTPNLNDTAQWDPRNSDSQTRSTEHDLTLELNSKQQGFSTRYADQPATLSAEARHAKTQHQITRTDNPHIYKRLAFQNRPSNVDCIGRKISFNWRGIPRRFTL
ncbi:MAG: hypothetical protein VX438_06120, partial [Planctomycetota bacterium]|nr:hypothetical protein [Planctomycetota bacterium]